MPTEPIIVLLERWSVLKMCVLFLASDWEHRSDCPARYVSDAGMRVTLCQLKVKMQECQRYQLLCVAWIRNAGILADQSRDPPRPFCPPDKNFEDDDSVDGGRSSSSSKGASLSGRKTVSMGSFRRPSSASGSKSAGQR